MKNETILFLNFSVKVFSVLNQTRKDTLSEHQRRLNGLSSWQELRHLEGMYTPLRNLKPSREWVSFWNIFIRIRAHRRETSPSIWTGGWEGNDRGVRPSDRRLRYSRARHSSALDSDRWTWRTGARRQIASAARCPSASDHAPRLRLQFYLRVPLGTGSVWRPIRLSWFLTPESSLRRYVCWSMDPRFTSRRHRRHIWLSKLSHSSAVRSAWSLIVSGVHGSPDKTNAKILGMRIQIYVQITTPSV